MTPPLAGSAIVIGLFNIGGAHRSVPAGGGGGAAVRTDTDTVAPAQMAGVPSSQTV